MTLLQLHQNLINDCLFTHPDGSLVHLCVMFGIVWTFTFPQLVFYIYVVFQLTGEFRRLGGWVCGDSITHFFLLPFTDIML